MTLLRHKMTLYGLAKRLYSGKPVSLGRSRPPGLNDALKLWWAKEVTPDYHVAGRLSERQMKYASESGFKSVLSLFQYDESGRFGSEYLPTTQESKDIVEQKCRINFASLLSPGEDWCSVEAVKKMADVLPTLPKPVLLHSEHGRSITFVLLMHLAQLSRQTSTSQPVDSSRIYELSSRMGLDFTNAVTKEIVAQVTGERVVKDPESPKTEPSTWYKFWPCNPVYGNWFTSGQITPSDMTVLETTGFKSVINMRLRLTANGKPTQEEVNLLNIPAKTGTYATDTTLARQQEQRLEDTRIDPSKPNIYIDSNSKVNFESRNEAEFGDEMGYNCDLQQKAFEKSKLNYYHFPTAVTGPYEPYFEEHLEIFLKAGSDGPVLVQCARAFRAAYAATLSAAIQHKRSLTWALEKSRDLGYGVSKEETPDIYNVYEKYLKN